MALGPSEGTMVSDRWLCRVRGLVLAGSFSVASVVAGCSDGSQDAAAAPQEDPLEVVDAASAGVEDGGDAAPEMLPPDEIVQGTGGVSGDDVPPVVNSAMADNPAATAEQDEGAASSGAALSDLPGYVPSIREETPSLESDVPDLAAGLPVLFRVSVLELTPNVPEDLRPLKQFLGEGSSALDPTERASLDELLGVLADRGLVRRVSSPTLLIAEGSSAAVEIVSAGAGTARERVSMQLAPKFRSLALAEDEGMDPAGPDAGQQAARTIQVRFSFRTSEAGNRFEVLAQDLGLPVGPRAGVDGRVEVDDLASFVIVRRVIGDDADREFLLLITPRIMPADFSK